MRCDAWCVVDEFTAFMFHVDLLKGNNRPKTKIQMMVVSAASGAVQSRYLLCVSDVMGQQQQVQRSAHDKHTFSATACLPIGGSGGMAVASGHGLVNNELFVNFFCGVDFLWSWNFCGRGT